MRENTAVPQDMIRDNHEATGSNWSPVRQMCRAVGGELGDISAAVTEFIRDTVPEYLVVPEDDHRAGVESQLRIRLAALSQRRPLNETELSASSGLAAARAAQGIPIDALIAAHQAGDREIWRLVVERGSPALGPLMPEIGRMMFAATSAATEVMARTHSRVARDIDGGRITLAHQFLELLGNPNEHAEASLIAGRLGFDPHGEFVGLVWLPTLGTEMAPPHEEASSLRSASLGIAVRAVGEGRFEMIAQGGDPELLTAQISERLRGGRLGIGLPRQGLAGALASLADARIALVATSPSRPSIRFAEHWPEALILAGGDQIRPLIQRAVDVARDQPHLAKTVLAFANSDMSLAATAEHIHLHANSVTYRLDRWASLTGEQPRTFDGLMRSVIACRLAGVLTATCEPN